MKFQPGQNKIQKGRTTYIRDVSPKQRIPVIKEDQPKEDQPKENKDESIQHKQVVQKQIPTGSKPKRRKGRPSSKSNRPSDSGS